MEMRSALGRVRGLGTSQEGGGHWWAERLTGLALVPLTLWFVYSAIGLVGADLAAFKTWAGHHGNALLLVAFIGTLFHHTQLGLQAIIEDYIHNETVKFAAIIFVKFAAVIGALSCVLSVLRLAFGS